MDDSSWKVNIESRIRALETQSAADTVRYEHLLSIVTDIKGVMSRLQWTVMAGIAAAIVNFVIEGGLIVP